MIIKKPYAFLIKNFRLIHGILFIMLTYLAINTFNIYTFFSGYATNNYYVSQTDLAGSYVSFLMYIACIFVILISFIVYYLLEVKNKSNKMYIFISLYAFILFIYFIYISSVFNGLETTSLKLEEIRALRDIALIVLVPQLVFLIVIFGRTLGFNIKKFDFKRDLEELQIDSADSEEVEVTLTDNSYKIKRFFRKLLRLTKYFFLENRIFVIGVASVIVLIISIVLFNRINIYSESYNENENILANTIWYNVKESYITNLDARNNVINSDKSYVLVIVDVSNKFNSIYSLDSSIFRLDINGNYVFPSLSSSDKFVDLGTVFTESDIGAGEDKELIVVFEIDKVDIKNEYIFKIKNSNIKNSYKDVIIKPSMIDNVKNMGTFLLPNEIDLKDSLLKDSKILISSYEIADRFKEEYTYKTNDGKIHNAVYSIIPSSVDKQNKTIIRFKTSLILDKNLKINKTIKNVTDFFNYFCSIRYRYLGNYKNVKLEKMNLGFESKDYIYLEIPAEVKEANKIELIILIRGIKYTISLK